MEIETVRKLSHKLSQADELQSTVDSLRMNLDRIYTIDIKAFDMNNVLVEEWEQLDEDLTRKIIIKTIGVMNDIITDIHKEIKGYKE